VRASAYFVPESRRRALPHRFDERRDYLIEIDADVVDLGP